MERRLAAPATDRESSRGLPKLPSPRSLGQIAGYRDHVPPQFAARRDQGRDDAAVDGTEMEVEDVDDRGHLLSQPAVTAAGRLQ
jgi:hypothetical protein